MTFLYKLTEGACPKSYGPNVARLAGLPASLVKRASELSSRLETSSADKGTTLTQAMADIKRGSQPAEGVAEELELPELNTLRAVCSHLASGEATGETNRLQELQGVV